MTTCHSFLIFENVILIFENVILIFEKYKIILRQNSQN